MTYAQYCRLGVHVGASDRTVIARATRRMLKASGRTRAKREARHAWLRMILAEHHDARDIFRRVA